MEWFSKAGVLWLNQEPLHIIKEEMSSASLTSTPSLLYQFQKDTTKHQTKRKG